MKAVKDITGIVIKPKYPTNLVVQEAPRVHGAMASGNMPF